VSESDSDISMETKLIVNPNLVLREEGDEGALLYDPDTGAVRVLNVTAVAIWKLLEAERTVPEVILALREQFEGLDTEGEDQVLQMVCQLRLLGALRTAAKPC
jgi:hypothetical protein